MTFGELVREFREREGISRYRLSKDAGLPYAVIWYIEEGVTKSPGLKTILKLGDYFGKEFYNKINRKGIKEC